MVGRRPGGHEAGAVEDVQSGMLRRGEAAQKARQGLQHSNGTDPSKGCDAENWKMNG